MYSFVTLRPKKRIFLGSDGLGRKIAQLLKSGITGKVERIKPSRKRKAT